MYSILNTVAFTILIIEKWHAFHALRQHCQQSTPLQICQTALNYCTCHAEKNDCWGEVSSQGENFRTNISDKIAWTPTPLAKFVLENLRIMSSLVKTVQHNCTVHFYRLGFHTDEPGHYGTSHKTKQFTMPGTGTAKLSLKRLDQYIN